MSHALAAIPSHLELTARKACVASERVYRLTCRWDASSGSPDGRFPVAPDLGNRFECLDEPAAVAAAACLLGIDGWILFQGMS